ncbi:MAG TPA: V-type ATP synthase subunit F [Anaerolineales bacterium]|nr:V-type ATP synthase subunit F [Anaerolineales bacterium]
MSSLRIVVRPDLAPGFALAGVETFSVERAETAASLLTSWLDGGETGLIGLDERILSELERPLLKRLDTSNRLFHIAVPAGTFSGTAEARQERIATLIRQAIGFHITFRHEDN